MKALCLILLAISCIFITSVKSKKHDALVEDNDFAEFEEFEDDGKVIKCNFILKDLKLKLCIPLDFDGMLGRGAINKIANDFIFMSLICIPSFNLRSLNLVYKPEEHF